MPTMPSSVVSSITVRVVPVSTPRLQRQGASAGTVTGVALMSMIFIVRFRPPGLPAPDRAAYQTQRLTLERLAVDSPQEVEVAAHVRLQHMVAVQSGVAATVFTGRRPKAFHPPLQLDRPDVEVNPAGFHVEHYCVPIPDHS